VLGTLTAYQDRHDYQGERSMKLAVSVAGAVLCAISLPHLAAAAQVPQYQYVDLGRHPQGWTVAAGAINNAGTVAGSFYHPEGLGSAAFQYSNGRLTPLTLPLQFSASGSLNERGEITGLMSASDPGFFLEYRGFFFSPSRGALDLGQLSVGGKVEPRGINDSGLVTGRAELSPGGTWHAFLWDPATGAMKNLGSPNGSYSEGVAINASGILLANVTSKTTRNAYVYEKGVWTVIAPGKVSSVGGSSLSADGFVAGSYEVAPGQPRAFLWSKGKLTDLGTLGGRTSVARGINASHQIVGYADTAAGEPHLFFYDGKMKDVTALATAAGVRTDAPFELSVADMNSLGYLLLNQGSSYLGLNTPIVHKKGRFEVLNPQTLLPNGSLGAVYGGAINDFGQVIGTYTDGDGDIFRGFIATPISLLFQRLWDAVISFPTLRTSEGAAWTAYANYDVKTSDTQLAKFITDVNTLVAQKKLSATLGNKWIADAQAIRAAVKG
jgi:probable HAF family extracellular repeat protein